MEGNSADSDKEITADELIDKLRASLARQGDFPASAKVVTELKELTANPKTTQNQVAEVILKEPSLGMRVLHLVNSSFYRRSKPIMTISQAVVQIGMKPLGELCAGLILLRKFVPMARRGGPFANCLKRTVLTSILSSTISTEVSAESEAKGATKNEQGYLTGSFAEIGTLLLAYYFPNIYENAAKRAEQKNLSMDQAILELTGISATQLSLEVIDALRLPEFYGHVLQAKDALGSGKSVDDVIAELEIDPGKNNLHHSSDVLFAAQTISEVIVGSPTKEEMDKAVGKIRSVTSFDDSVLSSTIGKLPELFQDHCSAIELDLPALPEYVSSYCPSGASETDILLEESVDFAKYVDEIRQAVENREPTASIITSVMETLAWCLHFDRVLLLLRSSNKKNLMGRMMLGNVGATDPTKIVRPLGEGAHRYAPDNQAFAEGRPVFNGDPLFEDGWPIAVLPIGGGDKVVGVIYADRIDSDTEELDSKELACMSVLTELLNRSVGVGSD